MNFTKREIVLLSAALSYACSNTDDMNDAFAPWSDDDEDNELGLVKVQGQTHKAFGEAEFYALLERIHTEASGS